MKLKNTKVSSSGKTSPWGNVVLTILNQIQTCILKFRIPISILIALVCISGQPAIANGNMEQINSTIVADLNQTVGKDMISLVDTHNLAININPDFNVIWSPDGSKMLIRGSIFLPPEDGGKFGSGMISALYVANANGSDVKRVTWGKLSYSGGESITAPVWSHSGEYFAYTKLSKGKMYRVTSSQLFIMSSDMQLIRQIELNPEMIELESDPSNFKCSPAEDKIATLVAGKLIVYDLTENTNLSFDLPDNTAYVENMEWSPDGEKIVFIQNIHNIIVVDIEKREVNRIHSAEHVGMYHAQWSPDSKKLVFYEISGSEEDGTLRYDIYVIDNEGKAEKIAAFDSGSSRVIQWYPDSERVLVKNSSDNAYGLYSLSINGDNHKIITGDASLDGKINENGYVLATSFSSGSRTPPYTRTYDLLLINESAQLTIDDVTSYTWEDDNLIFTTDTNISVLNTNTHDIWYTPMPLNNIEKSNLHPSGRFIAMDNIILELQNKNVCTMVEHDISNPTVEVAVSNSEFDEQVEVKNTKAIFRLLNLLRTWYSCIISA